MRIGEFGKQLENHLKNGKLEFESDNNSDKYNHYRVHNFPKLYKAISFIDKQDWLKDYIDPRLKTIFSNFSITDKTIDLTNSDYSTVRSAIAKLNEKLLITMGLIRDFSPDQDENEINIKLPNSITSLKELQEFNERLDHIFKLFNVTGEFELKGFDRGSEWYEISINAPALYAYFLAALSIAWTIVRIRKDFYESELAKVHVELLKKRKITTSEEEVGDEITQLQVEKEAKKAVQHLGVVDSKSSNEMETMVIKAATELVKEIEKGTEFHLSLNPPKYISEDENKSILEIDYRSIPPVAKKKETKMIDSQSPKNKADK